MYHPYMFFKLLASYPKYNPQSLSFQYTRKMEFLTYYKPYNDSPRIMGFIHININLKYL